MASLTIVYWRDIPSQVIVKSGRTAAKRELTERFIRAIDAAAMHARAKSADLETEMKRKKLQDMEDNLARDVRNSWLDTQKAYARLTVTQQLLEQANLALELAQARYKLGLSSIVEFSQAELQKTDADLQDTDAKYQYRLTQIMLAYQMGERR